MGHGGGSRGHGSLQSGQHLPVFCHCLLHTLQLCLCTSQQLVHTRCIQLIHGSLQLFQTRCKRLTSLFQRHHRPVGAGDAALYLADTIRDAIELLRASCQLLFPGCISQQAGLQRGGSIVQLRSGIPELRNLGQSRCQRLNAGLQLRCAIIELLRSVLQLQARIIQLLHAACQFAHRPQLRDLLQIQVIGHGHHQPGRIVLLHIGRDLDFIRDVQLLRHIRQTGLLHGFLQAWNSREGQELICAIGHNLALGALHVLAVLCIHVHHAARQEGGMNRHGLPVELHLLSDVVREPDSDSQLSALSRQVFGLDVPAVQGVVDLHRNRQFFRGVAFVPDVLLRRVPGIGLA